MKKILTLVLVAALALSAVFAGGSKEVAEKDEYIFGTDATWAPFEFIDENGNLTGFDVELVSLIGEKVGKNFVAKNIAWDTIFAGLLNGQYDGVASGVTVTEERKQTIDFSTTYATVGQVVLVPTESSLTGIDDLAGKAVGVQIGTTGDLALDEYDTNTKRYDDITLAVKDMINGNLDACVCDSLIAGEMLKNNADYAAKLKVVGEPFTAEEYAIGVKKGNTELLNLINEGLKIAEEDGSLAELKAKWGII